MEIMLLKKSTAHDSNNWFKNGWASLENEEYTGRSALSTNDKNMAEVCETWVLCLIEKLYGIQGIVSDVKRWRNNLILIYENDQQD
jgi:hypothetical protein